MQDPAQGYREVNILKSFYFKLFPSGSPKVDHDDLQDTGAKRHPLVHFVKTESNVVSRLSGRSASNQKMGGISRWMKLDG